MFVSRETLLAVARVPLRRPSAWRVYLVLLARGSPSNISIAELATAAGISARSVKGALRDLRHLGLVRRADGLLVVSTPPVTALESSFTPRQDRAVDRLVRRAAKLLNTDADAVTLPYADLERLGFVPPMTVRSVYEALKRDSTPEARRKFVGALVDFVNSEQVLGHEVGGHSSIGEKLRL